MYENVGMECLSPESSNHSLPKRNGLSFLWRKETIFIYFMVITFAVYEREQNWPLSNNTPLIFVRNLGDSLFSGK